MMLYSMQSIICIYVNIKQLVLCIIMCSPFYMTFIICSYSRIKYSPFKMICRFNTIACMK